MELKDALAEGTLTALHFRTPGLFASDAMEGEFYKQLQDRSAISLKQSIVNLPAGAREFRRFFHEEGAIGMVVLSPDGTPIARRGGPMEISEAVWLLVTAESAWREGRLQPEGSSVAALAQAALEYLRLGCDDRAKQIYTELALGRDPEAQAAGELGLCRIFLLAGDVEGAGRRLSRYSGSDSPERRFLQGWLHFQRREVTAARDLWDGLASGSLDTPELAYYLALSLHETGEDARAVRLLRQVVASEEASFPSRARSQLAHIQSAEHGHTH